MQDQANIETPKDPAQPPTCGGLDAAPCSAIVGAKYADRNGIIVNGGHWILEAANRRENFIRMVPENQTIPICWESTFENFSKTFILMPNISHQPPL